MKLIDEASKWYLMFSQRAIVAIVSLQGALAALPADWLAAKLPVTSYTYGQFVIALTIVVAVLGFVGRLLDQGITPTNGQPK